MAKLFISYRRDDSKGSVGRLYDTLMKYFDKSEIFMDVYTIKTGEDFETAIENAVGSCDTLIAVIGPRWLDNYDEQGVRRLMKPNDYVRLEITAALKRQIQVIPVLVERVSMPGEPDLPKDLAALARCNAIDLSHDRFAYDVDRLVQSIGGAYGKLWVHLGSTYRNLVKTRMMGHTIIFDIQIDQKKVGQLRKPSLRFGRDESTEKPWKSHLLQLEAGVHHLSVRYRRSENDDGVSSNEVSFRIKGGQIIQFVIERETSSMGQSKISLKPYKPIL